MRSVAGGVAAAWLAVGAGYCEEPDKGAAVREGAAPATVLYFSGADLWRNGVFAHGGFLWSPKGLEQEGFAFKLLAHSGGYRYWSGALSSEVIGIQYLGSLMAGWRFKFEKLEIITFAGLDLQDHRLFPDDTGSRLRGFYTGGRFGADFWYEPLPLVMLAANTSVSTIGWGFWTRAATGLRVFDALWMGPEALAQGDPTYQQFRAGIHATGLKTDRFEWSAGAGFVTDTDGRNGPYVRIGVIARR